MVDNSADYHSLNSSTNSSMIGLSQSVLSMPSVRPPLSLRHSGNLMNTINLSELNNRSATASPLSPSSSPSPIREVDTSATQKRNSYQETPYFRYEHQR